MGARDPAFRATLPLPPSVNEALRPARMRMGGKEVIRLVKTREAEAFKSSCRALLSRLACSKALHAGPLEFYLTVYVPSLSSDGGNRVKLLEDALKGIVIDDDRQFVEWHVVKRIDGKRPRAEVVVKPANPSEHAEVAERLERAEKRVRPERGRKQGGSSRRRAGASIPSSFRLQPTPAVHQPSRTR